jgi:hypothetical protein
MKNDELQPSENLANHFAPYRDEAPLISAPEIEKLLAGSATADHPPTPSFFRRGSFFNNRRILMTLSGIAGLAAFSYFAFFSNHSNGINGTTATNGHNTTQRSYLTHQSHVLANDTLSQLATPASAPAKHTSQLLKKGNGHGPWSAGNDQFYADLSREELAKLGIVVMGDTLRTYNLDSKGMLEGQALTKRSMRDRKDPPSSQDVHIPRFFPVLTTFSNGHGAFYRIESAEKSEWGMITDDSSEEAAQRSIREYLANPGTPGLSAYKFEEVNCVTTDSAHPHGIETITVNVKIGKDLPQQILKPLETFKLRKISDSVKNALIQLAHFYAGSNVPLPTISWPTNLTINVDTVNASDIISEMDSHVNNAAKLRLQSIFARLNDLVPVLVRHTAGTGNPDSNDFILWYEPSEELFNALPPAQAAIFRTKLAEPPHCISMPNEVLTTAEITYCVAEPQVVQVVVRDLTGKVMIFMSQLATAGDNVLQFPTETLPSGMYVVTVRDNDSSERSQRLWVENAHPKLSKDINWNSDSPHAPDQLFFNANDEPRTAIDNEMSKNHPGLLNIPSIELNAESLAKLGIESDSETAGWYRQNDKSKAVNYLGIMRTGSGVKFNTMDEDSVTTVSVVSFGPIIVTDGVGRCSLLPPGDSAKQAKAFAAIDKFIPILLREKASSDSITKRDLIFWYKPTPEFLALLPDSARAVAQMMASGASNTPASVTDLHGAIQQAVAFPNPSKGQFSVKLTLGDARSLMFTLRNLLGQQAAPSVQARMDGTGEQSLDFSSVPEGVYLLDISSDQGERYIERVVITH